MVHQRQPILTIEVLEAIIDQADDTITLRSLSLTCSALSPRARYHLFNSLTIRTLKKLQSSLEFFHSHPRVRPLVQKVILSVDLPYDYSHRNIPLLAVVPVHLLSQLPNLRVWCMGADIFVLRDPVYLSLHRCTLSRYKRFSHHIQDLELFNIAFNDISDFVGLVSSFTGVHTLNCSRIWFRTAEEQESKSSLKASRMSLFARSLKFETLHLGTSVDIRAVGYLLNPSLTALNALTLNIDAPQIEQPDYFERLGGLLSGLSHLSTLTYAILGYNWEYREGDEQDVSDSDQILLQDIRRATRILERVSRTRLGVVQVVFQMDRIDSLARCISWSDAPLEPCKELEGVLLTFPRFSLQFRAAKVEHRGRRAEFWRHIIKNAFPRLNGRGLLAFPPTTGPDIVADPLAHESSVKCLVASHDSQRIVSASSDGTIIIWDTERGAIVHEWLAHRGPILGLGLSPDSRRLVSAGGEGQGALAVWDISDAVSRAATLEGHTRALTACAWSPDGTLIASADTAGTVRVWNALTFRERDVLEPGERRETLSRPESLRFSSNARYLAWISKSLPGTLGSDICCLWRPLTGEDSRTLGLPCDLNRRIVIRAYSFDPEGKRVAIAYGSAYGQPEEDVVRICDLVTGAEIAVLAGHTRDVTDASFSPDGRSVLSASADGGAKIWDAESGEEMASFKPEPGRWVELGRACFSPDGKYVATASFPGDSKVQLWRIEDGANVAACPAHGWSVEHVVFSPNGEFLASGDMEGVVHIRRVSSFAQY